MCVCVFFFFFFFALGAECKLKPHAKGLNKNPEQVTPRIYQESNRTIKALAGTF